LKGPLKLKIGSYSYIKWNKWKDTTLTYDWSVFAAFHHVFSQKAFWSTAGLSLRPFHHKVEEVEGKVEGGRLFFILWHRLIMA
jgi:hypothetical protein